MEPIKPKNILREIADKRSQRIKLQGPTTGYTIPKKRQVPLVDFISAQNKNSPTSPSPTTASTLPKNNSILIAEIKRMSPSKGTIAPIPEPETLANQYIESGFRRISVLTEEEYFRGSLNDLMKVKQQHPHVSVLRKDFLLTPDDITISHRAGADAVLLIASLLDQKTITSMFHLAQKLGLQSLVEVHDQKDVLKVKNLKPPLIGINSRNLETFTIDPLKPLKTRNTIDWETSIVYESGIHGQADASFVRGTGFSGFLVGESVAKDPSLAKKLILAWDNKTESERIYSAWTRLYSRYNEHHPLIKICGITNPEDANFAVKSGCDILGFIMADSPRRTDAHTIQSCSSLPVPKSLVLTLNPEEELPTIAQDLLSEGAIDFIQFHGDESPQTVRSWPSYKAMRIRSTSDTQHLKNAGSPAVLIDAYSPTAKGGTGKLIDSTLISSVKETTEPLWLAGGLNPQNIQSIVSRWNPDLVDVSSGTESSPGKKDHKAITDFIKSARTRTSQP